MFLYLNIKIDPSVSHQLKQNCQQTNMLRILIMDGPSKLFLAHVKELRWGFM